MVPPGLRAPVGVPKFPVSAAPPGPRFPEGSSPLKRPKAFQGAHGADGVQGRQSVQDIQHNLPLPSNTRAALHALNDYHAHRYCNLVSMTMPQDPALNKVWFDGHAAGREVGYLGAGTRRASEEDQRQAYREGLGSIHQ